MLKGIGASSGIAIGSTLKIHDSKLDIKKVTRQNFDGELDALSEAINKTRLDLEKIKIKTFEKLGKDKADIFDAHLLILDDPEVFNKTKTIIESEMINASWALQTVVNEYITLFRSMNNEYMNERATDIQDVFSKVLNYLEGITTQDLSLLTDKVILIADDLTPSQIATMNKDAIIGILTNKGGKSSHTSIMARTLEIPAVAGLKNITETADNSLVILDGKLGEVIIDPNEKQLTYYKELQNELTKEAKELHRLVGKEAITKDQLKIELAGNIGTHNDLESFHKNDAESVGLYRTEFLFLDRDSMPSEEEQFKEYSQIIKDLNGKECTIRTLDIGGDKELPYLKLEKEENPFLGYRAIRICLDQPEIFKTQLRAILRASVFGKVNIMFPMISSIDELKAAKEIYWQCQKELEKENLDFSHNIKIGMMIEIPSAAIMSDLFAKHVDFFSLGTNDLTQYTCAVDRVNPKIEHLYDPFNPGLMRLINYTASMAKKYNIEVSVCGSMAHYPELVPFFIGCGVTKLSMSPIHILKTKKQILDLEFSKCEDIKDSIFNMETSEEIKDYLTDFYKGIK